MPEINPYEPPQSKLTHASSKASHAVAGAKIGRYIVPSLVGLQIAAVGLAYLFHVMQALAHSNYQRLEVFVTVFVFSFLGLGLLLFLIGLVRGSVMLIIGEAIALGVFDWWSMPVIH